MKKRKNTLRQRAYLSWLRASNPDNYEDGWLAGYRACQRDLHQVKLKIGVLNAKRNLQKR